MSPETPDPTLRRRLAIAGGALVALAVGCGGFTGRTSLITAIVGEPAMPLTAALGFLLSGLGFLGSARGWRRATQAAGLLVLLLGAGLLIYYVLVGVLELRRFYAAPAGADFGGLMSPTTAAALGLLGVGLLLLGERRPRFAWIVLCASVVLMMALLAFLSHVAGMRMTLPWWPYPAVVANPAMPVPIAAGVGFGAAGLVAWVVGRMQASGRTLARTLPFFAAAAATVLVLGAIMVVANERRRETARTVTQVLEFKTGIAEFISATARLETSTRNYLLSGEERYLSRMQLYRADITAAVATLARLAPDAGTREELVRSLGPLVDRKFASNDAQIRARRERGEAAAVQLLVTEPPEILGGLRLATDQFGRDAQARMARLTAESADRERLVKIFLAGGLLTTLALIGFAFTLVNRAQADLQRANDELEERVRARTAELQARAVQLRESERRLRFLADTMPQLVWTARPDGTIESVNHGWLDYLGKATEAEAIAGLVGVVHRDDKPALDAEWAAMRSEARSAGGEIRLRRIDGEYRWHLWRAHPERDSSDRIVRWVGTSTDIHDQKLAEEVLERRVAERTAELTTSEERFRHAFDFAGTGMALIGLDGRWLRVNKSICEITGYSEAELLTKTFQDITHPDDLAADLAHVQELLEGRRRFYQMEKRYIRRDGRPVWIRLTASLVHDPAGAPMHFVSQVEDITERKGLEASLAVARDQALEASRMKSEFLATMSHEIRTPMNGVIGMTALLRDTPLNQIQADYVRTIESSGEALLTIINDILDYSKIEAGRIELEVATFDLRQCVEDALDLFSAPASEKKIELVYLMGSGVPGHVAGDAARLRQILVNLLGNALKFTETGEIVITVDAEPVDGRHRLRFAVKDTGIGIPPEGMDRLFKSFSQVDASTTRRFGGTGLGLVISRRLAELMGGEMWAESAPGEGSTFHFTVLVDARSHLVQHNLQTKQPELEGRHLLVVDDNATNRRVVAGLATAWGMTVREAASGPAALALLAADPRCDVAVLDMHMPEMDGDELAAAIHRLPACAHLPLALLTSLGRRTTSADFSQSLAKPVKADALFGAIRACVRPGSGATGRVAPVAPAYDATLGRRCPLRLLVAEDNPVNQRVANLLLQRLGYRAATVANGLEVIEALALTDYDAILMDVEMPELDGCEATRRIRAARVSVTRPWIIALTAGAMQNDRERALDAGMNDFLTKPVRTEALSEALARAHATLAAELPPA